MIVKSPGFRSNDIIADLWTLEHVKKESKHKTKIFISSGSSGSLYSQIINGAPLDIFLSGDQELPQKLEFSEKGIKGTRFTYATGKLVVYTTKKFLFGQSFPQFLTSNKINYIGIGKPEYVPYGRAAIEVLKSLKVFKEILPVGVKVIRHLVQFNCLGIRPSNVRNKDNPDICIDGLVRKAKMGIEPPFAFFT